MRMFKWVLDHAAGACLKGTEDGKRDAAEEGLEEEIIPSRVNIHARGRKPKCVSPVSFSEADFKLKQLALGGLMWPSEEFVSANDVE